LDSITKISAVIIVKDAEQTIGQTLESLKDFGEVILYDNGSIDRTLPIAGKFENVKIVLGEFTGFGDTKNVAASFTKNDWIFSIDSDEVLSSKLHDAIDAIELNDNCVYWFYRYNYYRKKRVRFSGWGKEKVTRLYNKNVTHFNNKLVHEGIEVSRNLHLVKLPGEIMHYSYTSVSDFNKKRSLYSDLFALENQGTRKSSPFIAILSGTYAFFNTFLLRLAFLDGYRGLLIAVSNAHETFLKHLKLYEANLENNFKVSLVLNASGNKEILSLSLKSILNQSILPNEIIVVNPYKIPEQKKIIADFVKKSFIKVFVIEGDNGFNIAQLRNMAIAKSKYDYLIFVDGSSVLHEYFIKDHLRFVKKGVYLQGDSIRLTKHFSDEIVKNKKFRRPYIKIGGINLGNRGFRIIFLANFFGLFKLNKPLKHSLNNFSIFKNELIKLNGFDEDLALPKLCDADLLERLYVSGVKRKGLRFIANLYRLSGIGTGWFGKLNVVLKTDKTPKCNNGLDKYQVEKPNLKKLI